MIDKGIARNGYLVVDFNSKNIGVITSGTISPTLSKAIALAYVVKDFSFIGTEVFIKIRNKEIKAKVVSLPFVK